MKIAIPILAGLVIIAVLTVAFFFPFKPADNVVSADYSSYIGDISIHTANGMSSIGYACVYAETPQFLQLLTASHVVNDSKQDYFISFHNGITVKVSAVKVLRKDSDLAILEVPNERLQKSREYEVPQFKKLRFEDVGQHLYIWGDEYDNYPERKIDMVKEKANIAEIYLPGTIATGRSGSPVFFKNTNICVGVISGFFTKASSVGEKIVCLFLKDNE